MKVGLGAELLIQGMHGLGDCIYQRSVLQGMLQHGRFYLITPWPELVSDLSIPCVPPSTRLRTQLKNVERQAGLYQTAPRGLELKGLHYIPHTPKVNMLRGLELSAGCTAGPFDLPPLPPPPLPDIGPYVLMRPNTHRAEWEQRSRSPRNDYLHSISMLLRGRLARVSVADVDPPHEVFDGDPPRADHIFHRGEFSSLELLSLVRHARLVVGGVGWIVPAALATGTPLLCLGGGRGAHNHPSVLTDPRMDLSRAVFLLPDPYCPCEAKTHGCNKTIPTFDIRIERTLDELLLRGAGPVHPSEIRGRDAALASRALDGSPHAGDSA